MNIRLLVAVLAIPLAACGSGAKSAESPPSEEPTQTGVPSVEPTGPEPPVPTGRKDPSINLPALPVGGGSDDTRAVHQCVTASWLGNDFPRGAVITVTGVQIVQRDGVFQRDKGACGGHKECAASFQFRSKADTCSVRVTAKKPGEAELTLQGTCPPAQAEQCQHIDRGQIGLFYEPDEPQPSSAETSASE
jgi:hypothetical protein